MPLREKMRFADLMLSNYKELAVISERKGDFALSLVYYKNKPGLKIRFTRVKR